VTNTLLNFATIAGEALYNDTELKFNAEQAVVITQIIAEWSFHKSVDLVRSKLPQEFWDPIMQKIAFTIFEVAKQAFKQSLPQDQVLQLVEHHVKKTYFDSIAELKQKNLIDNELMELAASQSNIDVMMQEQMQQEQMQQEQGSHTQDTQQSTGNDETAVSKQNVPIQVAESNPKILKLATLALLFQKMKQDKVQTILNKFTPDDANSVIKFMGMNDLDQKVDAIAAMRCLQEIKTNLPNSKTLSSGKLINKIQNVSQYFDRPQLEQLLSTERPKVKRFVFNALEGEYYEIAPKVANIIATHIEDSV